MKERIIVGATSVLADQMAKQWAARGDRLTLIGRNGNRLAALAKDLQQKGASQVEIAVFDFSSPQVLWQQIDELFLEKEKVDTLLVAIGYRGPGSEILGNPDKVHQVFSLTLESVAMVILAAKPHFLRYASGTIAAFVPPEADLARPETYLYGSAKAGLRYFLEGLREEIKVRGVHVCMLSPTNIETPINRGVMKPGRLWTTAELFAREAVLDLEDSPTVYYPYRLRFISWLRRCLPRRLALRLPQ